jgi:hypothetical protein
MDVFMDVSQREGRENVHGEPKNVHYGQLRKRSTLLRTARRTP